MTSTRKTLTAIGAAIPAALIAGVAFAAGDGTGIEAGFTETATALETLFGGAGGFIIMIVSLIFGVVMAAMGRGFAPIALSIGVGFVLAYGVPALTGISGVSADTAILETTQIGASETLIE